MRMDQRTEAKELKSEHALMRKKKIAVFMLFFSFYLGLTVVDSACSEMTRYPGALTLQSTRIDEDHLQISFMGKEMTLDTSSILSEISRMTESASDAVSVLTKMAVGREDDGQSQIKHTRDRELPFPSKTL